MLEDAGIEVIYAFDSPLCRVQAAELIGKVLNLKAKKITRKPAAVDDWIRRLPTEHAKQRVMVVPGRNSGLRILGGLGVPDRRDWGTDILFVVVPNEGQEPVVIKMRW